MRRLVSVFTCVLSLAAGCLALLAVAPAASAVPAVAAGTFQPVDSTRVLDTRLGTGLAAAQTTRFAVTGKGAIPAGASAVAINMTVLKAAKAGSIAVFPGDTVWTGMASISFAAGQTKQNMITAKLGSNGTLAVRNNIPATIQVIGDVVGYYTGGIPSAAGSFQPIPLQRAFDTRAVGSHPLATGSVTRMPLAGQGAVPATGVSAVVANLTVITPARAGSVSTFASDAAWDGSASVSFAAGRSEQDVLSISLGADGAAMIRNNTGVSLVVVLDLIGYYLGGTPNSYGSYQPITPMRVFDSRLDTVDSAPLQSGDVDQIRPSRDAVTGASRLPEWGVPAVVVRFTVLAPARAGTISVFPGTEAWNGAASIAFGTGASVQQQLIAVLGPDGRLQLRNNTAGQLLMVADVLGYYLGVPNPLHYTSGQEIDPRHGRLAAVSCPTASFCMAAQQAGFAESWNGASWGTPARAGQASTLNSVSCASASFCVAGGTGPTGVPELSSFNGSAWSHAASLSSQSSDVEVSCASATSCVATAETSYRTFSSGSWSSEKPTGGHLRALSCPSASFCLAVDQLGRTYTFDGAGWSAPVTVAGFAPWAVDCPSATFCVAVGQTAAAQFDGTNWTPAGVVDPGRSLLSVSCASSTSCRAVDNAGGVVSLAGLAWSGPVAADANGGAAISCSAAGNCALIDTSAKETAVMFNGTSWGSPQTVDLVPGDLDGVSCLSTDFCVAVDTGGYALSYDGANWTAPTQIDGGTALTAVSCTEPSTCVAVDAIGRALSFNGSSWSAPVSVDAGQQLTSVSCADPSFCVAVGTDGKAARFNGGSWSIPTTLPGGSPLAAVSCPSESFCVAIDYSGSASTFDGTAWSTGTVTSGAGATELSCASAMSCLAAGTFFGSWNGAGWSPVGGPQHHGTLALSCPDQQLCVLQNADGSVGGQALVWDGSQWSMSVDSPAGGDYGRAAISCPTTDFCMQVNGFTSAYRLDG
ncbi:MAG: hypothetical protein ACJ74U_06895 [Jatrophihabitantaceae bacterium]